MEDKKKVSQKENNENLLRALKEWIDLEEQSIASLREVINSLDNPLISLVLQIIQSDSALHKRVQQFIVDSLEKQAITLSPDDLAKFWGGIEKHLELERKAVKLAQEAKVNSTNFVHKYLINYLLTDELKHDQLLDQLENIKRGIYPYA